ncbi:MAG: hypothetical protein DRG78_09030 [Epsilonproteobacteria bacterium]|nr:MAG: hypothetical protein DRG78_09030 [Campylobacterota bacterium]
MIMIVLLLTLGIIAVIIGVSGILDGLPIILSVVFFSLSFSLFVISDIGVMRDNTIISEIEYLKIIQNINGTYSIIDKEYNKIFPTVIISDKTVFIKKEYVHKGIKSLFFINTSNRKLYLNIKDVEK